MSKKLIAGIIVAGLTIAGLAWQLSTRQDDDTLTLVQNIASNVLMTPVLISEFSIDENAGQVSLEGLSIDNPEGYSRKYALELFSINAELDLNATHENLLVIESMQINTPHISLETNNPGDSNIHMLLKNINTVSHENDTAVQNKELRIIINELTISNGVIKASPIEKPQQFLNISLPLVTVAGIGRAQGGISPEDAARIVAGEMFNSAVKTAMNSRVYQKLKAEDKTWLEGIRKNLESKDQ